VFFLSAALLVCSHRIALADLPHPVPTFSPVPPPEVGAPVDVQDNPIAVFDDFSWRSFVALNWPALTGQRGVADTSKHIGDAGRTVWETWKADYELFQEHGEPPTEWSSFDAHTPCKDLAFQNSGNTKVLASFSKFGDFAQAGFGNLLGPLVAQNKTYVRYEVRVNRPQFDFIRDNRLYLRSMFPGPNAPPLRFPNNSIEIKAAWRVTKADELQAARGRYYLTKAIVLDPVANSCSEQDVALVGLHIVQKTELRPQWVWSSFEHIDNVPDFGVSNATGNFSFNDPAKAQVLDPVKSPPPINAANPPIPDPVPMQVIRQKDIQPSTKQTNRDYHDKLTGTVWTNYILVMTQWPTKPRDPQSTPPDNQMGAPFPNEAASFNLANVTMETYFQKQSLPNTKAFGCMKCHDGARDQKTDFVWFMHLRAFGPMTPQSEKAISVLRMMIQPQ
jgi:hypothetical protein